LFFDDSIGHFVGISGFYFVFIAIIIGFLMISKIRYEAFPKLTKEGLRQNLLLTSFMIFSVIVSIISEGKVIVFLLIIYILFGFFRSIIKSTVNYFKESFSK